MKRTTLAIALTVVAVAITVAPAGAATQSPLRVTPKQINFGTRHVGTETLKGVTIKNTSSEDLLVLVEARPLPDDFGFGLLPGSTCPVFDPGETLAAGETCVAIVRFTPHAFFAGLRQTAQLLVTARNPESGALIATVSVPIKARGML
jgi:hypothetical protein